MDDDRILTSDEVNDRIWRLVGQRDEMAKLMRFSQIHSEKSGLEPKELIGEAVKRILGLDRTWAAHIDTLVFVKGVIASVASDSYRSHVRTRDRLARYGPDIDGDVVPQADANPEYIDIINRLPKKPLVKEIFKLLVLRYEGRDICEELNLTPKEYDTKRRFLRRWLDKYILNWS